MRPLLREANSALVGTIFQIPDELIEVLKQAYATYGRKVHGGKSVATQGMKRCETLIRDGQLEYYQIKRMIHDMEQINPKTDPVGYALNGGYEMYTWACRVLDNARREVEGHKHSRKQANDMGGLGGIRKNAYLSTHEKGGGDGLDGILFNTDSDYQTNLTPMVSEARRIRQLMGLSAGDFPTNRTGL